MNTKGEITKEWITKKKEEKKKLIKKKILVKKMEKSTKKGKEIKEKCKNRSY